jgi:hypothetical protein
MNGCRFVAVSLRQAGHTRLAASWALEFFVPFIRSCDIFYKPASTGSLPAK